jgi:hypothetical protein
MSDEERDKRIQDIEVDGNEGIGEGDDEEWDEEVKRGCIHRCLMKSGCSYVANMPSKWPRTCGLLLGVVCQVCACPCRFSRRLVLNLLPVLLL